MAFDFGQLKQAFEQVMEIVGDELKTIKTGRAKPAMVEDIVVEAYDSKMPIKELASITAPDTSMIVVQPWDGGVVSAIEKALGQNQFSAAVDGQMIRIKIPPLTGETREQMVKQVAQKIESGKQMIRSQRTDTKRDVEGQEGSAGVSEDDIKADLEELERITGEYMDKLEELGQAKESELKSM